MRSAEWCNERVFEGELIRVGRWRLPVDHPHWIESDRAQSYLFAFPRTSLWIKHHDRDPFVADPNVVTYYNEGQEFSREAIAPDGDRCEYFRVNVGLLRELVRSWDPAAADASERVFTFRYGPSDAKLYWRQRAVYRHVRARAVPDALFVEETIVDVLDRLLELAYRTFRAAPHRRAAAAHHDIADQVRALIARDPAAKMTLSDLAGTVGISAFHLCRVFRAATGRTIHSYRKEVRLRQALERIKSPGADLTQVALELGFSSHSHFTAAFRQLYGFTPSEARRVV